MKTLKKVLVQVVAVDDIPLLSKMDENKLYVSKEYMTHKCLCGCGSMINLPITNGGWNFSIEHGLASVTPSILNSGCNAHYIITNGIANLV